MSTLSENIAQVINDFDNIKGAIINKGVAVPSNTPTSQYSNKIEQIAGGGVDIYNFFPKTPMINGALLPSLITKVPSIDLSGMTLTNSFFSGFNRLEEIGEIDTRNSTNMSYFYYQCRALINPPITNCSKATNMSYICYECSVLESIDLVDTANVINASYAFQEDKKLRDIKGLNITSKCTNVAYMFANCNSLENYPEMDTSNVTDMRTMITFTSGVSAIKSVPEYNAGKVTLLANFLNGYMDYAPNFTEFGGLKDLGKAYLTTAAINTANYTLNLSNCPYLTHGSLMNAVNKLYDIASIGVKPQQLTLGSVNLNKLTDEEIAIATDKGWTVS